MQAEPNGFHPSAMWQKRNVDGILNSKKIEQSTEIVRAE
jgi:hypothetical protein